MKQSLRLLTKTSFSQYATPFSEPIPGCKACGKRSLYDCEEYLKCYVHQLSNTYNHPIGTCKMGSVNDTQSVVDERLRVIGVSGLRVIDASIMPEMINGNPNAATIMIGEHGAQMIKDNNN
jgi:choline dehydrogenase